MPPKRLHYFVEKRKKQKAPQTLNCTPKGKAIRRIQICIRCGRKFSFKEEHKSCPYCEGTLKRKNVILKIS